MQADNSCFTPELLSQLAEEEEDQIQGSLPSYLNSVFITRAAANIPTSTASPHTPSNAHHPASAGPDSVPSSLNHYSPVLFDSPSSSSNTPSLSKSPSQNKTAHSIASTQQRPICEQAMHQSSPYPWSRKRKRTMEEEEEKYHPPPSCVLLLECSRQPVGSVVSVLALILQGVS